MTDYSLFPGNISDCKIGEGVRIPKPGLVNLYGVSIGDETKIGAFVEIQSGVIIGKRCKISSHSFICEGVTLEEGVFIGHNVMFTNDRFPRAINPDGALKNSEDWSLEKTLVKEGANIGTGAIILPGITIGEYAMIGAGSIVTKDVLPYTLVLGNPARYIRDIKKEE